MISSSLLSTSSVSDVSDTSTESHRKKLKRTRKKINQWKDDKAKGILRKHYEDDDLTPPPTGLPDEIADDIGTKVRSMMDFSENMVMSTKKPGATLGRARLCKMCGKEGVMGAILIHIENKSI